MIFDFVAPNKSIVLLNVVVVTPEMPATVFSDMWQSFMAIVIAGTRTNLEPNAYLENSY
jgi:hypothetical protein